MRAHPARRPFSRSACSCHVLAADRYLDRTARAREGQAKYVDYMCRFDQKYSELNGALNKYDGNPFT